MKLITCFLIFFGCNSTKLFDKTIILQWEGDQNKPVPVIIFTTNNDYRNEKIKYSKIFTCKEIILTKLINKIPTVRQQDKSAIPLRVTIESGTQKFIYYFNKKEVLQLFYDFRFILTESDRLDIQKELIYMEESIFK